MSSKKSRTDNKDFDKFIADARREQELRQKSYRERALRIYPSVCARCGREFSGKKLRELTVHHKDHNHDNNPPDGSNWELLCLYCHDNEHSRHQVADWYDGQSSEREQAPTSTYRPFANLAEILKNKKKGEKNR